MRAYLLLVTLVMLSCRRGLYDEGIKPNAGLSPATLTGTLTDRTTGKPIERGSVTLMPRGGTVEPKDAVTGPAGEFQILQIAPGDYEVTLSARGFQPQSTKLRLQPRQDRGLRVSLSPVAIPCPQVRVGKPLPGCG
jgi:hypothetical protein